MSLLRSIRVSVLVLAAFLTGCADSNDSPVAPAEPTLAVTGIYPISGSVSGGTEVAVGGAGFREGTTVTFGGMPATRVRVTSSHVMFAIAPAHAAGEVDVVVANPDGRSASPPMRYRYLDGTEGPGPWDY